MELTLRHKLRGLRKLIKSIYINFQIIGNSRNLKVIVGAADTAQSGWISTNYPLLNLVDIQTFKKLFGQKKVNNFLAEHVWEHLLPEDAILACKNCFIYLNQGGVLRIAVPDGFHTDLNYLEQVKPGGCGAGADDHKILYNYKTLSKILLDSGFEVKLLEWFDVYGQFHFVDWLPVDGMIERSARFDERNKVNPTAYTSLIIDAIKP